MFTPFLLGLAGSLHCIGMCGPLALALPLPSSERWRVAGQMLAYNVGRAVTYSMLGIFFGLLGKGLELAGFQKVISILAGVLMLAAAVFSLQFERVISQFSGWKKTVAPLQKSLSRLLRDRPAGTSFSIGLLNGLLPCGMVYLALAGAISKTSGWEGGIFMAFFGLGTLPLMFLLGLASGEAGRGFAVSFKKNWQWVQPVLLAAAGVLMLMRGLNLDLSTFDAAVPSASFDCH